MHLHKYRNVMNVEIISRICTQILKRRLEKIANELLQKILSPIFYLNFIS